jgi:acetylornithine deacetylase/succinyl-diaminopimelate desuccinylase-like protein
MTVRRARPHVLFYGHYDVQPVDPLEPVGCNDPFDPKVTELEPGRKVITGRGSSDDKGQLMLFVEACRAYKQVAWLSCPAGDDPCSRARKNPARRR